MGRINEFGVDEDYEAMWADLAGPDPDELDDGEPEADEDDGL